MLQKTDYSLSTRTKILILLGVAFFAIHTFVFVSNYAMNLPHGDDFHYMRFSYELSRYGDFPIDEFLLPSGDNHLSFSIKLITLPNLILNSFDLINLYYLQWILMSLTLFFIYLTIKNTNKQLLWTIIPISASIYCPIFINGYWVFATNIWLFPALCISIIVYLFSRQKISWPIFSIGISLALFSTFFNLIGTVVWVTGLYFLHKNSSNQFSNIKFIFPWIAGIIFSVFMIITFTGTSEQVSFNRLFSLDALAFFSTYLSTSYRFGIDNIILSQIVGYATIIIVCYLLYHFKLKNNLNSNTFPWFLLILISVVAGVVITLGRVDLGHDGTQSFYKTLSSFSQIGIIVLISIIMKNLNKNKLKTNFYKFKIGLLLSVIILQMIFLIPSYYAGWEKAEHYYQQKQSVLQCFSLSHGNECLNSFAPGLTPPFEYKVLHILNYWLENRYSFFADDDFNKSNTIDMFNFNNFLNSSPTIIPTLGKIEKFNDQSIVDQKINIESEFIKLEGWILDSEPNTLDSIYLMIDSKPFLKYDDLYEIDIQNRSDMLINENTASGWTITFLAGYIDDNCHTISILGKSDNSLFELDQDILICKK
tara:strand:+ start:289 stop:2064 length:1776 start_codon:yes stop_codon:yes gene_type:complete